VIELPEMVTKTLDEVRAIADAAYPQLLDTLIERAGSSTV
jgi:hypothetical protein